MRRLQLSPDTRVLIDLRATGLLRAVAHAPTLSVRSPGCAVDVADPSAIDVPIEARFAVAAIEPPADLPPSDREKMRENMCGRDVLDASRFPTIELRGRYVGTLEGGRLSGDLHVRGAPRPISMVIRRKALAGEGSTAQDQGAGAGAGAGADDEQRIEVTGEWEGRLTDLGVRPYRALLGALKLDDWVRLRLEGVLAVR